MKFLKTSDKLSVMNNLEKHAVAYDINIRNEWLDLPTTDFIAKLINNIKLTAGLYRYDRVVGHTKSDFVIFNFICDNNILQEEIEYIVDMIGECVAEALTQDGKHKWEKDIWQPVNAIVQQLNMTLLGQTKLLNITCSIPMFTYNIKQNNEILYTLFKTDDEIKELEELGTEEEKETNE